MRTFRNAPLIVWAVLSSCCLLLSGTAQAVVISTPASFGSTPPAVINGDLLQTSATLTTQSGVFIHEGGLGPSALNDGVFAAAKLGVTSPTTGSSLVYTFDTSLYGLGYKVTSIITSGGWSDDGRDRQDITVSYTTVDNPLLQLLSNISFDPTGTYSSVTLTDSSGTLITGLKTLQFDFPNQESGYAGYGEFDVIGTGLVIPAPEPTTATLLGLGILAVCTLRRRRNQAARSIHAATYDK